MLRKGIYLIAICFFFLWIFLGTCRNEPSPASSAAGVMTALLTQATGHSGKQRKVASGGSGTRQGVWQPLVAVETLMVQLPIQQDWIFSNVQPWTGNIQFFSKWYLFLDEKELFIVSSQSLLICKILFSNCVQLKCVCSCRSVLLQEDGSSLELSRNSDLHLRPSADALKRLGLWGETGLLKSLCSASHSHKNNDKSVLYK